MLPEAKASSKNGLFLPVADWSYRPDRAFSLKYPPGYSVYKSHDLFELLGYCIKENKEFEKIKEECISLTNYAVETRYPFHKFELEENDVKEAINSMNKCNNLIIDVLNNYLQNEKENNNKEAPIDEDNTEDDDEEEM